MPKFRTPELPISAVLSAAALVLLVPVVVLVLWEGMALAEKERARVNNQALGIAFDVRAALDRTLTYYIAILETLASSPDVHEGNFAQLHERATTALQPAGLHILLRDATGVQLLNTRVQYGTELPREMGFDDPIFETKMPYITDVVIGAVTEKPVVGVSVPVLWKNDVRFILTLSLDPHLFVEILTNSDLSPDWIVNFVDRHGVRIARSQGHDELVGIEMPAGWKSDELGEPVTTPDFAGRTVDRFVLQSEVSGWCVVVSAGTESIVRDVTNAVTRSLIVSVGLTLMAVVAAYALGRHVVTKLGRLTAEARKLGAREKVSFEPTIFSEINTVGRALQNAAEQRDSDEAQIFLLMREVAHRSKNLLAVIQAIMRRTSEDDVDAFRERLSARIRGLAASQDVLASNRFQGAQLQELVASHASIFFGSESPRIHIAGPPVQLSEAATQAIGLALHELGTNAAKYGSLSSRKGTVNVEWEIVETGQKQRFTMSWREQGGPPPAPSRRAGFGRTIMVTQLEQALDAIVKLEFMPEGVEWSMNAPLEKVCQVARIEQGVRGDGGETADLGISV